MWPMWTLEVTEFFPVVHGNDPKTWKHEMHIAYMQGHFRSN